MKHTRQYRLDQHENRIRFGVERDCDWLAFRFHFDKSMTYGQLKLSDPFGMERFFYFDVHSPREGVLHVRPEWNSYTAVPGVIRAGEWSFELMRIPAPLVFALEWEYGDGEPPESFHLPAAPRDFWSDGAATEGKYFLLNRYDWKEAKQEGTRWYRGDFHTHTTLSDGRMTPEQATQFAEERGLDFFVVTEHNTLPSSWPKSRLLVIPGVEITTYGRGDWNIIGIGQSADFWSTISTRMRPLDDEQYAALDNGLRKRIKPSGAIRSLNQDRKSTRLNSSH